MEFVFVDVAFHQLDLGIWIPLSNNCSIMGEKHRHRNGAKCKLEWHGPRRLLVSATSQVNQKTKCKSRWP